MSAVMLRSSCFACLFVLALGCQREGAVAKSGVARASVDTEIEGAAGVSLLVPAGAVTEDTTLRIVVGVAARRPGRATPVSRFVRLEPEGKVFDRPVELTLPIDPASLPAGHDLDDVVVLRAPRNTDVYVPLPTRRAGESSVAVLTEHFSDFVAVVVDSGDASTATGCGDGTCSTGETCDSCPLECGLCIGSNLCGNRSCESNETRATCPYDCPCTSPCPGPLDGTGQCTTPTSCGPGSFEAQAPADGCDRLCNPCGPGTYADTAGATSCTPCGVGTASSAVGATSASTCVACASGFEAPIPGSSMCTDIDECLINGGGCAGGAASCVNNVGAPPTCLPIPVAGLSVWLDAGQFVFSDAGTTAATSGGAVQLWRDRTAMAHECIQSVVSARPTWEPAVAALNGQPALRFSSASSALLDCAAPQTVGTAFAVVVHEGGATFPSYAGIFGHKNNGSVAVLFGNAGQSTFGTDGGTISLNGVSTGGGSTTATTITAPSLLTTVLATPAVFGNWVGRADGVGGTWNGYIAEIIAYEGALSSPAISEVECYLAAKYAITIGHACP